MVIAAVDPNRQDLKLMVKFLRMVFIGCQVAMLEMNGFDLQAKAEAVQPAVLTVFVANTDNYAKKALETRAQDYIIKPVTRQAIWESMLETKFDCLKTAAQEEKTKIRLL